MSPRRNLAARGRRCSRLPLRRRTERGHDAHDADPEPGDDRRGRCRWKSPIVRTIEIPRRAPSASPAHAPRIAATTSERQPAAGVAADQDVERGVEDADEAPPGSSAGPTLTADGDQLPARATGRRSSRRRPGPARSGRRRGRRRRRRGRRPGRARRPRPARRSRRSSGRRGPARRRSPGGPSPGSARRDGGSGRRPGTASGRPALARDERHAARAANVVRLEVLAPTELDRVRQRIDPADVARRAERDARGPGAGRRCSAADAAVLPDPLAVGVERAGPAVGCQPARSRSASR